MAVALHVHVAPGTQRQQEQLEAIKRDVVRPDGLISYGSGTTDDGWCVVAVFRTRELAQRYFDERISLELANAGITVEPELVPLLGLDDDD